MRASRKITDTHTYQHYLSEHFHKDLVGLIQTYIVPILDDMKCLLPNCKPLSIAIMPNNSAAILTSEWVVRIDGKGNEEYLALDDEMEMFYNKILSLPNSKLALGSSERCGITISKPTDPICGGWITGDVNDMCVSPKGHIALMDSYGNIRFHSLDSKLMDAWKVKVPGFKMKNSCFAVLPENRVALACNTSRYMVLYDHNHFSGLKMERIEWRSVEEGFVKIFYSECREEIMLFDRDQQVINCCDMEGRHLYYLKLNYKPNTFVEDIFLKGNRVALVERDQDSVRKVNIATII